MSVFLVCFGLLVLAFAAYACGRLHEQYVQDQGEPERPADWAVSMARRDPQRLLNVLREGRLP
jgi:hypothetical protein